ncbi:hypothetical protein MMC2321_02482 [Chitinophaga sp. MM2321]
MKLQPIVTSLTHKDPVLFKVIPDFAGYLKYQVSVKKLINRDKGF